MKTANIFTLSVLLLLSSFTLNSLANSNQESITHNEAGFIDYALYHAGTPVDEKAVDKLIAEFSKEWSRSGDFDVKNNKIVVDFRLIENPSENYPAPSGDYLRYFGRGFNKEQGIELTKSSQVIDIYMAYPSSLAIKANDLGNKFMLKLTKDLGGFVWDNETRLIFTPLAWEENRIWKDARPFPAIEDHITIHAYQNDNGLVRAVSLGMAKFGLTDIAINDFSWSMNNQMGNLVTVLAQLLFEGNVVDNKGLLQTSIAKMQNKAYRQSIEAQLLPNAKPEILIQVAPSKLEEGDANNKLIEILFDNYEGKTTQQKQEAFVSSVFGWQESMSLVEHNALIEDASARARTKLPALQKEFQAGLEPGGHINVKAPFKTPDGGNEYMWVDVMKWQGDKITGLLKNEPYYIPDLKGGQTVEVSQAKIFDYIRYFGDGTQEGNETGRLIQQYQSQSISYDSK